MVVLLVTIINPILGVPEGLINLPVCEDFQGLSSFSFTPIKFIPGILSEMPRIFQEDVPLLGVLLLLALFIALGVALDA